jgi:hypothetical protein
MSRCAYLALPRLLPLCFDGRRGRFGAPARFFFSGLCGFGGVFSIRRNTPSSLT